MASAVKLLAYRIARSVGLFRLTLWLTRDRLRVLAYHAFASDEALLFRPKLFVSPAVLEQRGLITPPLEATPINFQCDYQ